MIEIRESTVAEFAQYAATLFDEHWQEVALNKQVMILKPDWQRYEAMEQQGALLALGAFDGDEMIGYSVSFV